MKKKIISTLLFIYLMGLGYAVIWNVKKTYEIQSTLHVIGSMIYSEQLRLRLKDDLNNRYNNNNNDNNVDDGNR